MPNVFVDWQVPINETSEKKKLGWLNEASQQGQKWQESQRTYRDYRKALDIFAGESADAGSLEYRSQLSSNRLRTNCRVAIAGLSNIRPMWGYHATKSMSGYANVLNRTVRALYFKHAWQQSIKEWLQYAAAFASGFIRPVYMRGKAGTGAGRISLLTYGLPCILPVQLPSDGNFQEAYAVTVLDEMPIFKAHAQWPLFQDRLRPTSSRYWYSSDIRSAAKQNTFKRSKSFWLGGQGGGDNLPEVYCGVRWTTINDLSINETGQEITMGQPGSSWQYKVPTYGQEIHVGFKEKSGSPLTRQADFDDARLYPYRRLMISSEDCIMYDGPAFNWHGEWDCIQLALDRYPWEPAGFSMFRDGYTIAKSIDAIDRGTMDKINAQANPALAYDMDAVTKYEAETFDPLQPRSRVGFQGSQVEKPFQMPIPPEALRVNAETMQWREKLIEELDYTTQTRDIVELGKARALGKGMDQLEALISASGPLVRDMSMAMEGSLTRVGSQVGSLVIQYMTTQQLLQYNDPESMQSQIFDFDPASLIPSHLPDDTPFDEGHNALPSRYSKLERGRWLGRNIEYSIMPGSAHEILQMSYRLMLLQYKQRGGPISWATILQSSGVPDVEMPDGNTEQERAQNEKRDMMLGDARIAREAQAIAGDLGLQGPPGGAPGAGKKPNGSGPKGGRPSTLNAPPHIQSKDGGTRSTVATSN